MAKAYTPEELSERFGRNIKYLRGQEGLTQHDLADRTGYSVGGICMMESAVRSFSVRSLADMARYFQISPGSLIDEDLSRDSREM